MVRESLRIRMTQRNVEPCLGKLHDVGTLKSKQTVTKKKREAWATDVHMAIGKKNQRNEDCRSAKFGRKSPNNIDTNTTAFV